jgi:hypothetical protein
MPAQQAGSLEFNPKIKNIKIKTNKQKPAKLKE